MEYRPSITQDLKLHEKYHQAKTAITYRSMFERIKRYKKYDIYPVCITSDVISKVNDLLGGTELNENRLYAVAACIDKVVHGCVIIETIDTAYKIIHTENYESLQCDKTRPFKVSAGIARVWISNESRRKGLATCLLDCARETFCFGVEIPKSQIAFSQPTAHGHKLAMKYFGCTDYLVYM